MDEVIVIDSDVSPVKENIRTTRRLNMKRRIIESDNSEDEVEEKKPRIKNETLQKNGKKLTGLAPKTRGTKQQKVKQENLSNSDSNYSDEDIMDIKPKINKRKIKSELNNEDDSKTKVKKTKTTRIKKETKTTKKTAPKKAISTNSTKSMLIWNEVGRLAEKENLDTSVSYELINMFEAGDTIPFIARYRKALTNDLPADKLRDIKESYEEICACRKKADTIINAIKKLGKFTPVIEVSVYKCKNMEELEYVYAPFKTGQKRTLAERAKQLGLEDSALAILNRQYINVNSLIKPDTEGLKSREDVETGIMHIIAHQITSNTETLEFIQKLRTELRMTLESKKSSKEPKDGEKKFEIYFDFKIPLQYIKPHQILAINRGENLKILSVKINIPDFAFNQFSYFCRRKFNILNEHSNLFNKSVEDAYKRKVQPLIIRQTRLELNTKAEKASIEVFALNLKKLLLMTPLKGQTILGIDPGFKVGCKIAVISPQGDVLDTSVIYPNTSSKDQKDAYIIKNFLHKHNCSLLALGNGTACRETENWLSDLIKSKFFSPLDVSYTIIDECGASIYSCSPEAKKEFPKLDPLLVSAVSLARRVQDPLAEMVKVEPQHLGVGMYQHDVNKKTLENTLNEIVSECVSFVGVDLNTASQCLLRRVAGLTDLRATNILKHRSAHGPFTNRWQIKDVKGIGDKIFEQCAGFLRVGPSCSTQAKEFYERPDANPLDCTWIHPESYSLTEKILQKFSCEITEVGKSSFIQNFSKCVLLHSAKLLAEEFNSPESTIQLIVDALQRPFDYDLRQEHNHKPIFRKEVTALSDISVDMVLTGHVRNVTSFGAFVDIGVGVNGLIHQSAMSGFNVQLGDKVEVKVLNLDINRQRIGLKVVNVI